MGGPYVHVGDPMILVPYKVRGHKIPIPYKVRGTISHIVPVGGPYVHVGDHMVPVPP